MISRNWFVFFRAAQNCILKFGYSLPNRYYKWFFLIINIYLRYPIKIKYAGDRILVKDKNSNYSLFNSRPRRISRYQSGIEFLCDSLFRSYSLDKVDFPEKALVIDIGANVGELSYALKKRFPQLKLIALEPDPIDYKDLVENVGLDHIALNKAAANFNGELEMFSQNDFGDTGVYQTIVGASKLSIPCVTLDEVYYSCCFEELIFLIKCEAEGFEPEVLLGSSKILQRTMYVAVDTGPERAGESTFDEVNLILSSSGFSLISSRKYRHLYKNLTFN
jgi:FkbM family methyltransferase